MRVSEFENYHGRRFNTQAVAVFLVAMVFTIGAEANRKINIPASGGLSLTNPSGVDVTFNVSCKDKNGAAVLTLANEKLNAGKSMTYGKPQGQACANNTTGTSPSGSINGITKCHSPMGIDHTVAANFCASGYHICSIPEYAASKGSADPYSVSGMLQTPSGTWSAYTYDPGTMTNTWQNFTGSSQRYAYADGMSYDYKCATSANGGGEVADRCSAYTSIDTMNGTAPTQVWDVLCCSNYQGIAQCQVEINTSATPAAGHLISPQFMGGKAF